MKNVPFSVSIAVLYGIVTFSPASVLANEPPVVRAIAKSLNEDKPASIKLLGRDPERKKLAYTIVQAPQHGSVTLKGRTALYRPDANYNGSDSFQYSVSNGAFLAAPALVTLTVKPVNDAPVAEPQSLKLPAGSVSTIALGATDGKAAPSSTASSPSPERASWH